MSHYEKKSGFFSCVFKMLFILVLFGALGMGGWYLWLKEIKHDPSVANKDFIEFLAEKTDIAKDMWEDFKELAPEKMATIKDDLDTIRKRLLEKKERTKVERDTLKKEEIDPNAPDPDDRPPMKTPEWIEKDEKKKAPGDSPEKKTTETEKKTEAPRKPLASKEDAPAEKAAPSSSPAKADEPEETLSPTEAKYLEALMTIHDCDKLMTRAANNDWDKPTLDEAEKGYRRAFKLLEEVHKANPEDQTVVQSMEYTQQRLYDIIKQRRAF